VASKITKKRRKSVARKSRFALRIAQTNMSQMLAGPKGACPVFPAGGHVGQE
jgi:hypothetical protein